MRIPLFPLVRRPFPELIALVALSGVSACGSGESSGPEPRSAVQATIDQTVVGGERRAVGVVIGIYPVGSQEPLATARTGEGGEASFRELEPGTYELAVEPPVGWAMAADEPERTTVTASAAGSVAVTFQLVPAETVTDIDGNAYRIVQIGDQRWTAENLTVTRFRNGDSIPHAPGDEAWGAARTSGSPAWSHFANQPAASRAYGRLYNEFAASDPRGICPEGWRVPADEDWFALEEYIGVSVDELTSEGWRAGRAAELRSRRTAPAGSPRWDAPNDGSTNLTGFSAVPNGYRVGLPQASAQEEGDFARQGASSSYWSATPKDGTDEQWAREIQSGREEIYRKGIFGYGVGIRCVQRAPVSL